MIKDIQQIKECPDCASANIVHNIQREQVICRECGLIFEPLVPQIEEVFERTHRMGAPATRTKAKAKKPTKSKAKKRKR
jgi:transcription initiation factor TFIIIB Brf1 subunit/transcription initiation factor TFIIB